MQMLYRSHESNLQYYEIFVKMGSSNVKNNIMCEEVVASLLFLCWIHLNSNL